MKNSKAYIMAACALLFTSCSSFAGAKYQFVFYNEGPKPLTLEAINQVSKVGDPDTYSKCMGDNWLTPPPSAPVTIQPNTSHTVSNVTDKNTGACGDANKVNTWRISDASDRSRFLNVQFFHTSYDEGGNPSNAAWKTMITEYYGGKYSENRGNPSIYPYPVLIQATCDGLDCRKKYALEKGNSTIVIDVGM